MANARGCSIPGSVAYLGGPGVSLERSFERRFRNIARVIRYRGGGDGGNDLERVMLAETGCHELIDVLIVKQTTLFDQGFCQCR
jgi:hypothetical protein